MFSKWTITGYDGVEPFYEVEVTISEARAREVIRLLAARHLTDDKIVQALTSKGNVLLEITRNEGGAYALSCGENPYYTARLS